MKIKTKDKSYDEVIKLKPYSRKYPKKPAAFWGFVMRTLGKADFKATDFSYTRENLEKAGDGPWFILMNHSSFIDLEIAAEVLKGKPYTIVCTSDGFVGKEWLMRAIGCFPTNKFVSDFKILADFRHITQKQNTSVLMYPEASYSFDGTATPLPYKFGVFVKRLGIPVVMIKTEGAFARDPLYNCLQKRKVKVSAKEYCLFSSEELKVLSADEIDAKLREAFTFDYFRWQQENRVKIDEPFRADGLERILYKCPVCGKEGTLKGSGTKITCSCGYSAELDEYGRLVPDDAYKDTFTHVPDWYAWERKEVAGEIASGSYCTDLEVDIRMLVDFKSIYNIGKGRLLHDKEGFKLWLSDGRLVFQQAASKSYSLYSDYFWYELGDMICVGDNDKLFYCFPGGGVPVAKARLAAEEMYKKSVKCRN